jgi:hypothetical protein
MTCNEYLIKFAAIEEYKQVLKHKKVYEDLILSFRSLVTDLLRYAEKHDIPISDRNKIQNNMEQAKKLIEYRIENMEGKEFIL